MWYNLSHALILGQIYASPLVNAALPRRVDDWARPVSPTGVFARLIARHVAGGQDDDGAEQGKYLENRIGWQKS